LDTNNSLHKAKPNCLTVLRYISSKHIS